MRYGIKMDGMLLETFDTPEDAYDNGKMTYEESGVFCEVVLVANNAKGLND